MIGKQNSSNIEKPRHLGTTQYRQPGHFQKSTTISHEPRETKNSEIKVKIQYHHRPTNSFKFDDPKTKNHLQDAITTAATLSNSKETGQPRLGDSR